MNFVDPVTVRGTADLAREDFHALADGTLGALVVPDLLSAEYCRRAVGAVDMTLFEEYDRSHYSAQALRIGPSLNEHRLQGKVSSHYWEAAQHGWTRWRELFPSLDLHDHVIDTLRAKLGPEVGPASLSGHSAYWGMLRRMETGTLVHWDDIRVEFPSPLFGDLRGGQISVNVFLEAPRGGGRLKLWSTPREGWHEQHRSSYGYADGTVVPAEADVNITPTTGSAVFFSSCNYHAVEPVLGGRRLAFSFFMALTANDAVLLWS